MQYPLIAREGYPIIYTVCAIVLVCLAGAWLTRGIPSVCLTVLTIIGFLFLLFCLYFFRDPERTVTRDEHALISPADGTVIDVKTRYGRLLPAGSRAAHQHFHVCFQRACKPHAADRHN